MNLQSSLNAKIEHRHIIRKIEEDLFDSAINSHRISEYLKHPILDGVFQIPPRILQEEKGIIKFIIRRAGNNNYYLISFIKDTTLLLKLEKIEKAANILLEKQYLALNLKTTDKNLYLLFFDRYIFLLSRDRVYFVSNKLTDEEKGLISSNLRSEYKVSAELSVRFMPISQKMKEFITKKINTRSIDNQDEQPIYWNHFYPEDKLIIKGEANPFLKRIKLDNITKPSIIMPVGSTYSWDCTIPENAIFDFSISLVDTYVYDSERIDFIIKINSDDMQAITYSFTVDRSLFQEKKWQDHRLDLKKFTGKDCRIELSARIKGEKLPNEERIFAIWAHPVIRRERRDNEKNVILISLDTLRADHLSCNGYHRLTSPEIDNIAYNGVLFENVITSSPWTLPAHMSILAGIYPLEGGYKQIKIEEDKDERHYKISRLSNDIITLAEYLKMNYYQTAAFTGGGFISSSYNFDQGFDFYLERLKSQKSAMKEIKNLLKWLDKNSKNKFFLFYHTYEIHAPYRRSIFRIKDRENLKERIISYYDSGILFTDKWLGKLFAELKKRNLFEKTLIIITSDHGENFDEQYLENWSGKHGITLYDSELKVPLIIGGALSFNPGKKIQKQVQTVDILPTILDYLDIDLDKDIRGRSLLPYILNKEVDKNEELAFSEAVYLDYRTFERRSIRSKSYKLIKNLPEKKNGEIPDYEVYDLKIDPYEAENIIKSHSDIFRKLSPVLEKITKAVRHNGRLLTRRKLRRNADRELMEQLKNLGYIAD